MTREFPSSASDGTDIVMEVLAELRCPACEAAAWNRSRGAPSTATCTSCSYRIRVGSQMISLAPSSNAGPTTFAQRLMEQPAIARIYERYWRPAFTRFLSGLSYREELELLRAQLPRDPTSRIVDWCCGTGLHGRTIARAMQPPGVVVGVDQSRAMVDIAASYGRAARIDRQIFIAADMHRVRFRAPFDAALCIAALHLLNDQASALAHMAKSLKPDASLIGAIPIRRAPVATGPLARIGWHLPTRHDFERTLDLAGFRLDWTDLRGRALLFRAARK